MKIKKTIFTGMAAITLFSASAAIIEMVNQPQTVEAKSISKYLRHNAAIYNSRGKRVGNRLYKKGKRVKVYGYKTIKGKKYARIGRGKYVKASNVASVVKQSSSKSNIKYTNNPAYPNNPLDRKLTTDDKLNAQAINETYAHNYTTAQIEEHEKTNKYFMSDVDSPFFTDIIDGKYKLSNIPGKDNMDKWQHLADHMGVKLTTSGKRWTMKELNALDKKQNKSKRAKIKSACYKKYAFIEWAVDLTGNSADKDMLYGDEFTGMDNESKALSEYHRLADSKKQKAARAKEAKAEANAEFDGGIYDRKTGMWIDTSKEYKKLVKSGMSKKAAQAQIDSEYADHSPVSEAEATRNQNLWNQFFNR